MVMEEIEFPNEDLRWLNNKGPKRPAEERWYLRCEVFIKWNFGLGEYDKETREVDIPLPNAVSLETATLDSCVLLRLPPMEQKEVIRLRRVSNLEIGPCVDCVHIVTPLKLIRQTTSPI